MCQEATRWKFQIYIVFFVFLSFFLSFWQAMEPTISGRLNTLANSTLITLFSEMLKFSKKKIPNQKNIVKDNSEYLGIFHLLKWIFQN